MVLPIMAYGDPVLRKKGEEITKDYPNLETLINDMFDTMERSRGVGLAAPQVGKSIRLFVIDSRKMYDENEEHKGLREVFINAKIIDETGEEWRFEEGCLSIPSIREEISRQPDILVQYYDRDFNFKEAKFTDMTARVIQHEYDHIEGKLFIDHLKPLKKQLLKSKLERISKGLVDVSYKMKFPKK